MDEIDALAAKAARRARTRKLVLRAALASLLAGLAVLSPEAANVLAPVVGTL